MTPEKKKKPITKVRTKYGITVSFMAVVGIILISRLFQLSVVDNDKWSKYADDMSVRYIYETAPRGDIVDRNGKIIAGSKPVYSVCMIRYGADEETIMDSIDEVMNLLEFEGKNILQHKDDLEAELNTKSYEAYKPVIISEDIGRELYEKIKEKNYPGIIALKSYERYYPYGATASHIVGYLGRITADEEKEYVENKGYRKESLIGKSGVEKLRESELCGKDAYIKLQVDSSGKIADIIEKTKGEKGKTLKLTIDMELQVAAEEALEDVINKAVGGGVFESRYGDISTVYAEKASVGAVVALDVNTGEILAMASFPDYNPNAFVQGMSQEEWNRLQKVNENDPLSPSPLYNVASMSAVQPGSTFKPVTALAALDCGLNKNKKLYDAGHVNLGGRSFGCFLWNKNGGNHGYLNLESAMKVSCNYYFFDIATGRDLATGENLNYNKNINIKNITDVAASLGLGEKTGFELEESTGIRPSATLKKEACKDALRNHLLAEQEYYFRASALYDRKAFRNDIEKIVNWADKYLTLEEIIGKLKKEPFVKKDKLRELAEDCKYNYFDRSDWSLGDTFNTAIGQGDNSYTTLQMANYTAAIGNGGIVNKVKLIYDGENHKSNSKTGDKGIRGRKISEEDIKVVRSSMAAVVNEKGGSLYGVFENFPYGAAGKTGTAQRAGRINTSDEKDYLIRHLHLIAPDVSYSQVQAEADRLMHRFPDVYDDEVTTLRRAVMNLSKLNITADDIDKYKDKYDNFAWTIAMAPAEKPEIAVAVMLVQGKSAVNAAIVAREVIGKYGEVSRWEKSF